MAAGREILLIYSQHYGDTDRCTGLLRPYRSFSDMLANVPKSQGIPISWLFAANRVLVNVCDEFDEVIFEDDEAPVIR